MCSETRVGLCVNALMYEWGEMTMREVEIKCSEELMSSSILWATTSFGCTVHVRHEEPLFHVIYFLKHVKCLHVFRWVYIWNCLRFAGCSLMFSSPAAWDLPHHTWFQASLPPHESILLDRTSVLLSEVVFVATRPFLNLIFISRST